MKLDELFSRSRSDEESLLQPDPVDRQDHSASFGDGNDNACNLRSIENELDVCFLNANGPRNMRTLN